MKTIRCYFEYSKETKGAVQYKEPDAGDNPLYLIGTLYLRKASLAAVTGVGYPTKIVVTVYIPESGLDEENLTTLLGTRGAPEVPSD